MYEILQVSKICFIFNIRSIDFEFVLISGSAISKTFKFK